MHCLSLTTIILGESLISQFLKSCVFFYLHGNYLFVAKMITLYNMIMPKRLTNAGDSLCGQVLKKSVQHMPVSGVQLVTIDPDVEAEPVRIRFWC